MATSRALKKGGPAREPTLPDSMVPRAKITVTGLHSESSLRVSEKSFWRLLNGDGERLERAALEAPICSKPWGLAFTIGDARAEERKEKSRMKDCILNRSELFFVKAEKTRYPTYGEVERSKCGKVEEIKSSLVAQPWIGWLILYFFEASKNPSFSNA